MSKSYFHVTPRHEVQHLGAVPMGDKSQAVRLADVFFIGPVMVVGGARLGGVLGNVLTVLGVATIAYNGNNWLTRRRIDSGA